MAEFITQDLVKGTGVEEQVLCTSAATSSEEIICDIGNSMYSAAKAELRRRGIPHGEKWVVLLRRTGCASYDYLVCMEKRNLRDAEHILRKDPEEKPRLLPSLAEKTGEKVEIADPWYTSDSVTCAGQVTAGCEDLPRVPGEAGVRPIAGGGTAR